MIIKTAVLVVALANPTSAQDGIRILRVPEAVRLPAAHGTNLLLEVEFVTGADGIWIATSDTATDSLPLVPAGANRYQINLADPRLAAVLPAGIDHGELFVFVKKGPTLARSTAIAWSRTGEDSALRCLVRTAGNQTTTLAPGHRCWIDLGKLTALEVQGAGERQSAAVARVGPLELPLRRDANKQVWSLANDAALRRIASEADHFEIEVMQGSTSCLFAFDLVPQRLRLPDDGGRLVVQQRRRNTLPGTDGWLRVHLEDITGGTVLVDLTTATGQSLVRSRLLRERDFVEFSLGEQKCVLVVESLVNLLVGEDHAELLVRPAAGFAPDEIGLLVAAVAASQDTFVREGKEYTGRLAAQFLTAKLAGHRDRAPTVDEFVATFASRSSRNGDPYQVRRADGSIVTMRAWLEAAREDLHADRQKESK